MIDRKGGNMNNKKIVFVAVISLISLISCGLLAPSHDSATITFTFSFPKADGENNQSSIPKSVASIEYIYLTISADDIATSLTLLEVEEDWRGYTATTTISVKTGDNRTFYVEGFDIDDNLLFTGEKIKDLEWESETVRIDIEWEDVGYTSTVTDYDGNVYQTVQIGNQVWMAENLRTTHYRDGTSVYYRSDANDWVNNADEAHCFYDNNAGNSDSYGALYNWYAVNGDLQGDGIKDYELAPEGWHIPTDEEWKELEIYLGMSQSDADGSSYARGTTEGSKLAGNAGLWTDGAIEAAIDFGSSGFEALPAGYRYSGDGTFSDLTYNTTFWTATEGSSTDAWARHLSYGYSEIFRDISVKTNGFSVRCVKD